MRSLADFTFFFVPDEALETYRTSWSNYADRIYPKSTLGFTAQTTAADGHSELLKAIGGVGKEANVKSLKIEGSINGYDIMLIRNKMTNLCYLDLSDATIVPEDDNYEYYTGCYTQENVLGSFSFYDADHLRTVVLPKNITAVGESAFACCDNLLAVTGMPECCTSVGSNAFADTEKLTHVELGEGITEMSSYCFSGSGISSITFPRNLESIGDGAFGGCCKLKDFRFPPSLKIIGSQAFEGCTSLKEIHVPSMLESIADDAFHACSQVKDVYAYTLTPISIQQNSFDCAGVTLHAPQEPEEVFWAYYIDTKWSQFANFVPFEAKYEMWYTGEDQDITLGDGETIPNEDDQQAEGEMRPGSCLEYMKGAYQWLDKLIMKWTGGNYPSLIDNPNVFVDEITFDLKVERNKWYFFSFPFDIDLAKCKFPSNKYVWRYYDGDLRAKEGSGAWTNVSDGKLKAFTGYIFQTNNNGNIQMVVSDPVFTGNDKSVGIDAHASAQAQDAGWNFVGNPFLSYYNLSNFINIFDMSITVWDPVNNTYNAVVPGDDDYEFHPFEAFFVQKPEGQDNIDFNKEGREDCNDALRTLQSSRRARAAQCINPARRIVNL